MMQYDLSQLHSSALEHLPRRLAKITGLNKNEACVAGGWVFRLQHSNYPTLLRDEASAVEVKCLRVSSAVRNNQQIGSTSVQDSFDHHNRVVGMEQAPWPSSSLVFVFVVLSDRSGSLPLWNPLTAIATSLRRRPSRSHLDDLVAHADNPGHSWGDS